MSAALTGRRVAVVNWRDLGHSLAGGSERYAWEFALALREAGASVDFLTARDRGQRPREVRTGSGSGAAGGPFTFYAWAAWCCLARRRRLDVVDRRRVRHPVVRAALRTRGAPPWSWSCTTCTWPSSRPTSRRRWPGSVSSSRAS